MTSFTTTMPVRLDPESRTLDRLVELPPDGRTIEFGAHGGVAEHYKMVPKNPRPSTLDYMVAAVAGCLIGTFAGSLKRARVPVTPATLTGTARGEVSCGEDNVLILRRIIVEYTLELPEEHRATAEEVHSVHASRCPNARSVAGAIEVETHLKIVPPSA